MNNQFKKNNVTPIEFINMLNRYKTSHTIFRGLGNKDYDLVPRIAQKIKDPKWIANNQLNILEDFENKLKSFNKKYLSPKQDNGYSLIYRLQEAQHLGLPTVFMDWTKEINVALYFAVRDLKSDVNGVVYFMDVYSPNYKQSFDFDKLNDENLLPFILAHGIFYNSKGQSEGDINKITQKGEFLIQNFKHCVTPLQNQAPKICDILVEISGSFKQEIHDFLLREYYEIREIKKELDLQNKDMALTSALTLINNKYGLT